jgi:protein-disulfide isomerase
MTIAHAALLQAEPPEKADSKTGWLTAGVAILLAMGGLSYTVQDLKEKIDLAGILIDAPDDVNEVLPIEAKVRGGADAKVTLIEFADVNCPACRTAYPEMKLALAKHGDDVRFAFRHLPFIDKPGHETSLLAAAIAEFAADKGLFWKFMDNVFHPSNRDRIKSLDGLYAVAAESGLDRAELVALLNSTEGELSDKADSYYQRVNDDIDLAATMFVTETPTLILYGDGLKSKVVHYTRVGSTLGDSPYRELLGSK